MRWSPAESVEYRLREALRETIRHCIHRSRLIEAAPFPRNFRATAAQDFDNNGRAAYYIPSKPQFVDSVAVHRSIHEREDAYPVAQDYAHLRQTRVSLFLVYQGCFAMRSGSN